MSNVADTKPTAVRTGLRRMPGWSPPEWVTILFLGQDRYRITPMVGADFTVLATSDADCMAQINAELRRRNPSGS